jgi:hypothetical protein
MQPWSRDLRPIVFHMISNKNEAKYCALRKDAPLLHVETAIFEKFDAMLRSRMDAPARVAWLTALSAR